MTLFASLGRVFGGARRGFGVPSMHRPLALLTAVLVLALLGGSASGRSVRRLAPVGQNAVFVVTGHGWGHGVGMSQYGAYGYAQHGFPYTKIVVHYFPGTTLGPAPVSKVRVLLASGQSALKLTSADDFTVKDAGGTAHDISAGTYTLTPKLKVKLANAASAKPLTGPLTFQPGPSPLQLGSRHYRGAIQLDVVDGKLRAIDERGRGRDGREGRPLRGRGREDVFLFDVRWTHRGRPGCLGRDRSLSRFGARPVRLNLALSRLGPVDAYRTKVRTRTARGRTGAGRADVSQLFGTRDNDDARFAKPRVL